MFIQEVSLNISISCTACDDLYRGDREPLKQITLNPIKLKRNFLFNKAYVSGNDTFVLFEINSASCWKKSFCFYIHSPATGKDKGREGTISSFRILYMWLLDSDSCSSEQRNRRPLHPWMPFAWDARSLEPLCWRGALLYLLLMNVMAVLFQHPCILLLIKQQWCLADHCASNQWSHLRCLTSSGQCRTSTNKHTPMADDWAANHISGRWHQRILSLTKWCPSEFNGRDVSQIDAPFAWQISLAFNWLHTQTT